eukprot:470394_1
MKILSIAGVEITGSIAASAAYSFLSLIILGIVCVYGWKRLKDKERTDAEKMHGVKKFTSWISLVWRMKSIYLSALVHIYDVCTDVGIMVQWMGLAIEETRNKKANNVRGLDMMALVIASFVAFFLYRFVSAGFVYEFTGKWQRACIQFLDLEIYNAIYITHNLGREEAGNLQRWLQKFEAIFESAPQSLFQIVYIIKTGDHGWLIMSSIALSFFSVAARFTSDDRIFFVEEAEKLGLKRQKRFPTKDKPQHFKAPKVAGHEDIMTNSDTEDDEETWNGSDLYPHQTTKAETSPTPSEAKEEDPPTKQVAEVEDINPSIQITHYDPTFIKFVYNHDKDTQYTEYRVQTAKIHNNSNDALLWNTRIMHYTPRSKEYCIKGLEPVTDYVFRMSFGTKQGKW